MEATVEVEILGVRIRRRSRVEALESLREFLAGDSPRSVYFVHAATANLAFEDPSYRAVLNRGDAVFNDGVGVKWAARLRGLHLRENLVGTDLMPALLQKTLARPLRVYLLGGRPGVAERAAAHIIRRYPGVNVVGVAHGYFPPDEEPAVVARIRELQPDALLVGMGNPRQELFIDRHLQALGCRLAVGVGGLLDHFAGRLRRAPPWVRNLGLEWCQLLMQQPHKWRRYLAGIPKFLWRISRPWRATWLRHAAVAGSSLMLALGLAEAMVRAVRPQILERYPEGLYVASTTRQYKLRPYFRGIFHYPEFQTEVRISSQGLREDREYARPDPNIRRILALGDSFTMGYSVDQAHTWVRVLESRLNHSGQARYQVINAGVPGYSTWQELAYLEEDGLALEPKTILLGFFMGNDVSDNAEPRLPVELHNGRLISTAARQGLLPFELRMLLARHSHLFHLAWRAGRRPGVLPTAYASEAEPGWQATAELMDRLAGACARQGIRLIVVLIPDRHRVETEQPAAYGFANRRMQELCRRAGLEAIDLLDSLAGPNLYFPQDGHWTARGNAAAAEAIFAYLSHDPD